MNCTMFMESLEALLDGAVEGSERAQMESHANSCESCRKEMALSRKARVAMQAFGAPSAPAGFANRVSNAARPTSVFARPRWRAAAAAALIVAGAGLGVYMLLSAGSVGAPQEPVAQETPKASEEFAPRQPIVTPEETTRAPELARAPEAATPGVERAEASDEEIAENLDVLENWDLINDPDVAIALALPDEEFDLLMSAMEEGM